MNRANPFISKSTTAFQRLTPFSSSISSKPQNITNLIECLLCSQSVTHSHMCPSCCKLFCESCIKNWIKTNNGQCPACFKPLDQSNLLNCSILGRQIQQALSKSVTKFRTPQISSIQSPVLSRAAPHTASQSIEQVTSPKLNQPVCEKHQLKLDYFCEQCTSSLCSDCAVLSNNHQGHRLCKLSQRKLKFRDTLAEINQKIWEYRRNVDQRVTELIKRKDRIVNQEEGQKINILTMHLGKIFNESMCRNDGAVKTKEDFLHKIGVEYDEASKYLCKTVAKIQGLSKPQFMRESEKIGAELLAQVNKKTTENLTQTFELVDCPIFPRFEQKISILNNYNQLRQRGEPILTESLVWKGFEWRLKIFPAGLHYEISKSLDDYISIHLQMKKSFIDCRFRYRIELVNQENRNKCMNYEFESQLRQGQEERLDKFVKISTVYSEGFLHQKGNIEIILYVRCSSYFLGTKIQSTMIIAKQKQLQRMSYHLGSLRNKVTLAGIQTNAQRDESQLLQRASIQTGAKRTHAIDGND